MVERAAADALKSAVCSPALSNEMPTISLEVPRTIQ